VPRIYDAEFRRRVVAAELALAEATMYRWKPQDLIGRGVKPLTPPASTASWLRPGDASRNWRPNWPWCGPRSYLRGAPKNQARRPTSLDGHHRRRLRQRRDRVVLG
jgi:hypothetical protein